MEFGSSRRVPTSFVKKVGEVGKDFEHRMSHKGASGTVGRSSRRERKLPSEVEPLGCEETKNNTEYISGEAEPLVSDCATGELICVGSQGVGELFYALDTVDKLLSDNDIGPSQDMDAVRTKVVKSTPVLNVKGVHSLATKIDHRNSCGLTEIYNWTDIHEYEETSGFGILNQSSTVIIGSVDKSDGKAGVNLNICQDVNSSALQDSHSEMLRISEAETKKLCKDMDGQGTNSHFIIRDLDLANTDDEEMMYHAGPNTQMAAEALESLLHGTPANSESTDDVPTDTGTLAEYPRRGMTTVRPFVKVSFQKSDSSSRSSKSIAMPLRREIVPHNRSSRRGTGTSKHGSSNSRLKNKGETENRKVKNEKRKLDGYSNVGTSIYANDSPVPFKRKKVRETVDATFATRIQEYTDPMVDGQLSVKKELIQSEHPISVSPVARRTRQSKSNLALNLSGNSSCIFKKPTNKQMAVRNSRLGNRGHKLTEDTSVSLRPRRKGHVENLNQSTKSGNISCHPEMQVIVGNQRKKPETSSLMEAAFTHPKGKRTHRNICKDLNNGNTNTSIPNHGVLSATVQTYMQQRKSEAIEESLPKILDGVKRRKRSASAHRPKADSIGCKVRGRPESSCVEATLSVNSPLFRPHSENDFGTFLTKASSEAHLNNDDYCAAIPMNNRVPLKEVTFSNQSMHVESYAEDVKENTEHDVFPKGKAESSGLVCMAPKKMNTKLPLPHVTGRTSCNKSLTEKSNTKTFIGLESAESASYRSLKELRRRKELSTVRVLFSNNLKDDVVKQQKKILARLGVLTASSISEATHFVTDKFARTRNMLEAIAMGKAVVTPMWVDSCGQASCFIDEKRYILRDLKKEKEIGFSMPVSLARASQSPLLQGKRVFITSNIKPDRELLISLVKSANGQLIEELESSVMKGEKVPDDLIVVSCEEDYAVCRHLMEKGGEIFSSELLLNGLVIQKLEFKRHRLSFIHAQ